MHLVGLHILSMDLQCHNPYWVTFIKAFCSCESDTNLIYSGGKESFFHPQPEYHNCVPAHRSRFRSLGQSSHCWIMICAIVIQRFSFSDIVFCLFLPRNLPKGAAQNIRQFRNFPDIGAISMLRKMIHNLCCRGKHLPRKIPNIDFTFHDTHFIWLHKPHQGLTVILADQLQ